MEPISTKKDEPRQGQPVCFFFLTMGRCIGSHPGPNVKIRKVYNFRAALRRPLCYNYAVRTYAVF